MLILSGNCVNANSTFLLQKRFISIIMYNKDSVPSARPLFNGNIILTLTCKYIFDLCLFDRTNNRYLSRKSTLQTNNLWSCLNLELPITTSDIEFRSVYAKVICVDNNSLPNDTKISQPFYRHSVTAVLSKQNLKYCDFFMINKKN